MADFGMTSTGFIPKRLADLLTDINTSLANVQDPATGEFLDPSGDPIISQLTGILAEGLAECWDAAFQASTQFDPLKATGSCLEGLVQLNGILRKTGSPSILNFNLAGTDGTTIPAGSLISNNDGSIAFATTSLVVLSGTTAVQAQCVAVGAISPANGTITNIATPITGWVSATNTGVSSLGTDQETLTALRARQQIATSSTAYRHIEAIAAAIGNIPGVVYQRVYQNNTLTTDSRGIPGKQIAAVVVGGDDTAIGKEIFLRSPVGIDFFGTTTASAVYVDAAGTSYDCKFSRPATVPITVEITLHITDASAWPSNGADLIKAAIVTYAQFGANNIQGFGPGRSVVLTRLYTPINSVDGHEIVSVLIAANADTPAAADIPINWNELSLWDITTITVTLT